MKRKRFRYICILVLTITSALVSGCNENLITNNSDYGFAVVVENRDTRTLKEKETFKYYVGPDSVLSLDLCERLKGYSFITFITQNGPVDKFMFNCEDDFTIASLDFQHTKITKHPEKPFEFEIFDFGYLEFFVFSFIPSLALTFVVLCVWALAGRESFSKYITAKSILLIFLSGVVVVCAASLLYKPVKDKEEGNRFLADQKILRIEEYERKLYYETHKANE